MKDDVVLKARHPWVLFLPPIVMIVAGVWGLGREEEVSRLVGWLLLLSGTGWTIRRLVIARTNTLHLTATRLTGRTGVMPIVTIDIVLKAGRASTPGKTC